MRTFKSAYTMAWDDPVPDSVAKVPAQLGKDCRAAYFNAAKGFYSGAGAVVDTGTLAGGTSMALLEGCKASGQSLTNRFLYAFDIFRCDEYTVGFFAKNFAGDWTPGKSFRHVYEKTTEGFSAHINIVEGDITQCKEWAGPPIDVLGIDIWKTQQTAEHCIRLFFPHLRIGSIVLQQDYNGRLPYIHTLMESFSGHFEKIHETREWGTVVFQTVRKFTAEDISNGLLRHSNSEERKLLAETAARRARLPHTALFIRIADCLREASFGGRTQAMKALEIAKAESLLLDDKFRHVFAVEIEKIEATLRSQPYDR